MSFDAQNFLNATFSGANDTRLTPCPAGEFLAQITKIGVSQGTSARGEWTRLDVTVEISDPTVQQATGLPSKSVRSGVMLDVLPTGGLDMSKGRNVGLGRLREAAGLNDPSQPFSFNQLTGRMVKVKVGHRNDPNDPSVVYDEVKAFLKAA